MYEDREYTLGDFHLGFDTPDFFEGLYAHGVFSRGLPTRSDLKNNKHAASLLEVLNAPERSVVVTEEVVDKRDPLRHCLERGWLSSECDGEDQIKYRFASQLHAHYVDWLLRAREDPIKDHDLHTFVIKVLEHFRRTNLKTREDLKSSGSPPQSIPEAEFQQEFYRACCDYTKGTVTTLPECGTPKGRIDFFIRSQRWGIEFLRDGNRRAAHNARFAGGKHGKWIEKEKMDDYIMIDFRSKVPTSVNEGKQIITTWRQSFIRIADGKILYAVSTDSWASMQIYDHKLDLICGHRLLQ